MRARLPHSRLLPAALYLLGAAPAALAAQEAASPAEPSDELIRAAWERLAPEERRDVVERFRQEVRWSETFQNRLLAFVLAGQERDPGLWQSQSPAPYFDPALHAPAQPIPRKELAAGDPRVVKQRQTFFFRVPERELESAWVYDYAARELSRVADVDEAGRTFRNGLRGFPPDLDLAEALVELRLDDGAQRAALSAFGHAYTDRDGRVYTGLTLYDAWASGGAMEMPDVDCLGIVHVVLDDWSTWRSVVPERQHDALYERIGELFQDARRHRGLRNALARCYLAGEVVLRDGYAVHLERFHALWDSVSSSPEELAAKLPDAKGWSAFLAGWDERCKAEPELLEQGRRRRATLVRDAGAVRRTLLGILRDSGALER